MLFRHPWPGVASVGGEPANFPRAGVVCIVRSGCWQLQISQCLYLPKYSIDEVWLFLLITDILITP